MAASAAAMVLGYKMLDENVNIAGVITNNVKSESHYNTLKEAIEKYTGVEVLGYFPPNKEFSLLIKKRKRMLPKYNVPFALFLCFYIFKINVQPYHL